jgi:S-adenosyl methyltransferase
VERPSWIPDGVDVTVPNAARMYDYALGGFHNFAVDRETADQIEQMIPGAKLNAHTNRAFVRRAVRWLLGQEIRQFLDIGSGIPTMGNVHEIAHSVTPDARVLYVDIDPVAVAHSKKILADITYARVVQADLTHPVDILDHPEVLDFLDFSQPMAVLLNAVLHFVPDTADPEGILALIHEAVVSGSYICVTHGNPIPEADSLRTMYRRTPTALFLRPPERVRELLAGWDIVEPGVVPVADWRPEPGEPQNPTIGMVAAVGRKP